MLLRPFGLQVEAGAAVLRRHRSHRQHRLAHLADLVVALAVDGEAVGPGKAVERARRLDAAGERLNRAGVALQVHVGLPGLVMRQCEQRIFGRRLGKLLGGALEFFRGEELLAGAVELQRLATALFVGELLRGERRGQGGEDEDGERKAPRNHGTPPGQKK